MKFHYNILWVIALLLAGILQSCYDDLGNYNYQDLNNISISEIEEDYVVEQFEDFTITPAISQESAENEDNLQYLWYMYRYGARDFADTLSFDRNLSVKVGSIPGLYNAVFKVTDKNTGIFTSYLFKVLVVNDYSNGLIILSNLNGKANLAILNEADKLYQDVYQTVNGTVAGENPVALGYIDNKRSKGVLILSDDEVGGVITDVTGFNKYGEYSDMFWLAIEQPKPKVFIKFGYDNTDDAIIDNGELYIRNYNAPPPIKYQASVSPGSNLYPVMFTASLFDDRILYDNGSQQFKSVGRGSYSNVLEVNDGAFEPANVGLKMLCGGDGFKGEGYGLFIDEADGKHYVLHFSCSPQKVLPLAKVELTSALDIQQATSFVVSSLSPQFFYAVDNKLYCIDALTDNTKLVHAFDAGVTIDHIELEKRESDRVMYVGTTSASATEKTGSLHIMSVEINGAVSETAVYPHVAGKIVDFMYKVVN